MKEITVYKYLGHDVRISKDKQTCELARPKLNKVLKWILPICLKTKVFNQCGLPILTNGAESLTFDETNHEEYERTKDLF